MDRILLINAVHDFHLGTFISQTVDLQPMHRIETSWGLNWLFFSHDSFRAIKINITSLVNFLKKYLVILVGQGVSG